MSGTRLNHPRTFIPSEEDAIAAKDASPRFAALKTNGQKSLSLRVESEGGEVTVSIPPSLFRLLSDALTNMATGNPVTIIPLHAELTTEEAADFLNVSRQFMIQLIEAAELPHGKWGTHHCIRFADLLEYKHKRDAECLQALEEMTREAQELGLY
jgi:excisionase family DNA binding protein